MATAATRSFKWLVCFAAGATLATLYHTHSTSHGTSLPACPQPAPATVATRADHEAAPDARHDRRAEHAELKRANRKLAEEKAEAERRAEAAAAAAAASAAKENATADTTPAVVPTSLVSTARAGETATACVNPAKPCVALVITGVVRSLVYPKVHRSIAEHVVGSLSRGGAQVDVHFFLDRSVEVNEGDSGEYKPGVQFKPHNVSDEKLKLVADALRPASVAYYVSATLPDDEEPPAGSGLTVWVFRNLARRQYTKHFANDRAWRRAKHFANTVGIRYDTWIWHRADFAWGAPLPPLHTFSRFHVSVPDLWGYNVNDRFALAPDHLAYRVFDVQHIAKYRCIGGPSAGMHRAYDYKKQECSEHVFAEDFNASFAKTLMGFCCHQKNKTHPYGHDGVAEHVSQHAYADQPQETVGNGDVGFTDIQQHRLFTFLVRASVGAKCGELGKQNGNAQVKKDPASLGLRVGCLAGFRDCSADSCDWPEWVHNLNFTPFYLADMLDDRCVTARWNSSALEWERCETHYHRAGKFAVRNRERLYEDPVFYRHSPEQMFLLYGSALILADPRRVDIYQCVDLSSEGEQKSRPVVLRASTKCSGADGGWKMQMDKRLKHRATGLCLGYDELSGELMGIHCMGEGKWRGWPGRRHKSGEWEAGFLYVRAVPLPVSGSSHSGARAVDFPRPM